MQNVGQHYSQIQRDAAAPAKGAGGARGAGGAHGAGGALAGGAGGAHARVEAGAGADDADAVDREQVPLTSAAFDQRHRLTSARGGWRLTVCARRSHAAVGALQGRDVGSRQAHVACAALPAGWRAAARRVRPLAPAPPPTPPRRGVQGLFELQWSNGLTTANGTNLLPQFPRRKRGVESLASPSGGGGGRAEDPFRPDGCRQGLPGCAQRW
jgi:hypothetical protein